MLLYKVYFYIYVVRAFRIWFIIMEIVKTICEDEFFLFYEITEKLHKKSIHLLIFDIFSLTTPKNNLVSLFNTICITK